MKLLRYCGFRAPVSNIRHPIAAKAVMPMTLLPDDIPFARQLVLALLLGNSDPLVVFDDQWRVVMLNPAAEKTFKAQNAVGLPAAELLPADLLAIAQGRQPPRSWLTEDGHSFVPQMQPVGENNGWLLTLRDTTQINKLSHSQHEFIRLVSHDLRSPLTSMRGFASMLEMRTNGDLTERQAYYVEKILSGITQMATLVDNIQDAGRFDPETGFYEMNRSQCDVGEIIQQIVENHLVPAEKGELTITVTLANNLPIINADALMLERAISNLVDNAIKYTPNGGKIEVGGHVTERALCVMVKDNGPGISPEDQKLLFRRHSRLMRQENKRIKGSGLGLFIVRSVAQRHGGEAWVESVEGQGSSFFFSIPLEGENLLCAD
jgi:signal transduction histidine kinase